MVLNEHIAIPAVALPSSIRIKLLGIRHEILDRAIGIAEQEGKILRHCGTLAEVKARLSNREETFTEAQRFDLEGRKVLAEAAIMAGRVRIAHWEAELDAFRDLYTETIVLKPRLRWYSFLKRLGHGIY